MRKSVWASVLLVLAASAVQADDAAVFVKVLAVKRGVLTPSIRAYGMVVSNPMAVRNLTASNAAEVTSVQVLSGTEVAKGQVLVELRNDPAVIAAQSQAVGSVDLARGELKRTQGLFALKLATESQLAVARKALSDAQSNLLSLSTLGSRGTVVALRAPFAATVANVVVQTGDRLQAGAPLLQLQQAGASRVLLGVTVENVAALRAGASATIQTPSQSGATLKGRVTAVHRVIDPQSRLMGVEVATDSGSRTLLVGTGVSAELATSDVSGWLVPRSAVLHDTEGAHVFRVQAAHARRVAVQILGETPAQYAIAAALPAPAMLVVEGNYELTDGMAVREAQTK